MEFWNHIIHTALLGTDRGTPAADAMPGALGEAAAGILAGETIDAEEKLLQVAALAFNYRRSGVMPVPGGGIHMDAAPPETHGYCSPAATRVLQDVLFLENTALLLLWLHHCHASTQIVAPEVVPSLFEMARQHKGLRALVATCCGRRGEWLSRFNPDWQLTTGGDEQTRWNTGTPEERKQVLYDMRVRDPAKAREWLQETWAQEDAATKTAFLELLFVNAGAADLPFLESLSAGKSKKVKEAALALLKVIPESGIISQYKALAQQAVQLKKEKTFLGMGSKTVLHIEWPSDIDEGIFRSGIEKLSREKGVKDEDFILQQILAAIPPETWDTCFGTEPLVTLNYFRQHSSGKIWIPGLAAAAARFRNREWAALFAGDKEAFYAGLIPLLQVQIRDKYLLQHLAQHPYPVLHYLTAENSAEWSPELAEGVISFTAQNPYQYARAFYSQYITFIPLSVASKLEQYKPAEEYSGRVWVSLTEHIRRLLTLKEQIAAAFSIH